MQNRTRRLRAYRPTTDALESLCPVSTMTPGLSVADGLVATATAASRPEGRDAGPPARASRTIELAADRMEARAARPRLHLQGGIPVSGRPRAAPTPVRGPGRSATVPVLPVFTPSARGPLRVSPPDAPQARGGRGPDATPTRQAPAPTASTPSRPVADSTRIAAVSTAGRVTAAGKGSTNPPAPPKGVRSFVVGNSADFISDATRLKTGLVLKGGSTDIDSAFTWMSGRAAGGDFLVLRASGTDAYNSYIKDLGVFDSVETLVQSAKTLAVTDYVAAKIRGAEAIWFAGGDQAQYVNYWKDTKVEDALNAAAARITIGGTSAGLAILGEYSYSALDGGSVTSPETLADPYSPKVTITDNFLRLPFMANTITDSHFYTRDRMGRLDTFLARVDQVEPSARAIGVEEKTALTVDEFGIATVIARPRLENPSPFVYFLEASPRLDNVVAPGKPLTYRDVPVHRAGEGDQFNLASWEPVTAASGPETRDYVLTADAGTLSSSSRGIYG